MHNSVNDGDDDLNFMSGFIFPEVETLSSSNNSCVEGEKVIERRRGDDILKNAINYISGRRSPLIVNNSFRHDGEDHSSRYSPLTMNDDIYNELKYRAFLIDYYMGSMSKCRGNSGLLLGKEGAIDALLSLLNQANVLMTKFSDRSTLSDRSSTISNSDMTNVVLDLISQILRALRDLSCGLAENRYSVGAFVLEISTATSISGIDILTSLIHRYHGISWRSILSWDYELKICSSSFSPEKIIHANSVRDTTSKNKLQESYTENNLSPITQPSCDRGKREMHLLTAAIGVLRNITHSTRSNCEALHQNGTINLLIWRLKTGNFDDTSSTFNYVKNGTGMHEKITSTSASIRNETRLPDTSQPWREACYRISGTLVNMADKCHDSAVLIASDDDLIYLLLDAWGGVNISDTSKEIKDSESREILWNKSSAGAPALHLGLLHILQERWLCHNEKNSKQEYGSSEAGLLQLIKWILNREQNRYQNAQRKEEFRKKLQP